MFLEGIQFQIDVFAGKYGVDRSTVLTRLILADGRVVLAEGLTTSDPSKGSSWGMVLGTKDREGEGIVLREEHVLFAELAVALDEPMTIGFASEAKREPTA